MKRLLLKELPQGMLQRRQQRQTHILVQMLKNLLDLVLKIKHGTLKAAENLI
jgi:hypothetical protein